MTESILSRRHFNHTPLISLLAAMGVPDGTATAQQQATSHAATRRDVIKQELPGEQVRDISLIEVTYPPATTSAPLLHAISQHSALLSLPTIEACLQSVTLISRVPPSQDCHIPKFLA